MSEIDLRNRIKPKYFRLGFLLHDVARLRRTVVDKALKPLGVTRSQWWVLLNLSRYSDERMMQTQLARVLEIGKVALGGMLDRLEANGNIERHLDMSDRRVKRLVITERGMELLTAIEAHASVINDSMTCTVTEENLLITEEALLQLRANLIAMDRELDTVGSIKGAEEAAVG
jgi:DNA-binding MarR family transcriptional regulator